LRPANALVLGYDHLGQAEAEAFESQIGEVRKYYQLVRLSEIAEALAKGRALGMAAIVFRQSRKSLFLRALPFLRTEDIPVTIFVRADHQGTNRLPAEEELRHFQQHYPGRLTEALVTEKVAEGWSNPATLDEFVRCCRQEIGPFPLNELDPTTFFSTWGSLMEFPPDRLEVGFYVGAGPGNEETLRTQLTFVRQQTRQPVRIGFWPRSDGNARHIAGALGLPAMLTTRLGAVEAGTSPWDLPQWSFENRERDGETNQAGQGG
jgi:hypothetical protein